MPCECDLIVDSGSSITTALHNSQSNDTICIEPGEYDPVGDVQNITNSTNISLIGCPTYNQSVDISCDRVKTKEYAFNISNSAITLIENLIIKDCNSSQITSTNIQIKNTTFMNNMGNFGGALEINGDSDVMIIDSHFKTNIANSHGGAISVQFSHFSLINSEFHNNSAVGFHPDFDGNFGGRGGALYAFQNSENMGNSKGGTNSPNSIQNCSFTQNSATLEGGAISLNLMIVKTTIEDSDFYENFISSNYDCLSDSCQIRGGAIHALYSPISLDLCNFEHNYISTIENDQVYDYIYIFFNCFIQY